jgi:hypothetical protein
MGDFREATEAAHFGGFALSAGTVALKTLYPSPMQQLTR